jgi:methylase of polypeptide subunit release factors
MTHYDDLMATPSPAPPHWAEPCTHQECSLHQLSPYIGKLKSSIAQDLILRYSKPGELVADMFCGSGTVPLEAARLGRCVFASDVSIYAVTLTQGKLQAPMTSETALAELADLLQYADALPMPDLRCVPRWVRAFFHPGTLKEALRFTKFLQRERKYFILASMLGILHHQRPGFLSFPSSHLVPYLRSKKFPQAEYPDLYAYRPLAPRLRAKVARALKRPPTQALVGFIENIYQSSVESVNLPDGIDCVITSPPYMNALDYGRDNRLRLWFLGEPYLESLDRLLTGLGGYISAIHALAKQLQEKVRPGGYCVFVVGERTTRKGDRFPSEVLTKIFTKHAPALRLDHVISDIIPDIRRSRRHLSGVRRETSLSFRKTKHA